MPVVQIVGLRSDLSIDRDGIVNFGCFKVPIELFYTVTDQQIADAAGENALQWWLEWKDVIEPLLKKIALAEDAYWSTDDNDKMTDMIGMGLDMHEIKRKGLNQKSTKKTVDRKARINGEPI